MNGLEFKFPIHHSDDNYLEILNKYVKSKIVDIIDWPKNHSQMEAYLDCINKHSEETEWLGFIDADEFIVPIEDNSIKRFLRRFNNRGSVLLNWKSFGYNGFKNRDLGGLCIEDFTQCTSKYSVNGKCFLNTNYELVYDKEHAMIHHVMYTKRNGKICPPVNCFDKYCTKEFQFARRNKQFPIQINHYVHKSYDESVVRRQKGDVCFKKSYRTDELFYRNESKMTSVDKSAFIYLAELKERLDI